jgi:hypothetical protein
LAAGKNGGRHREDVTDPVGNVPEVHLGKQVLRVSGREVHAPQKIGLAGLLLCLTQKGGRKIDLAVDANGDLALIRAEVCVKDLILRQQLPRGLGVAEIRKELQQRNRIGHGGSHFVWGWDRPARGCDRPPTED